MASTEFVDPYIDPETGLLLNKVGACARVALDDAEADLAFARLVQLMDHPPKPTGDLDELCAIHRHLSRMSTSGRGNYGPSTCERTLREPSSSCRSL